MLHIIFPNRRTLLPDVDHHWRCCENCHRSKLRVCSQGIPIPWVVASIFNTWQVSYLVTPTTKSYGALNTQEPSVALWLHSFPRMCGKCYFSRSAKEFKETPQTNITSVRNSFLSPGKILCWSVVEHGLFVPPWKWLVAVVAPVMCGTTFVLHFPDRSVINLHHNCLSSPPQQPFTKITF